MSKKPTRSGKKQAPRPSKWTRALTNGTAMLARVFNHQVHVHTLADFVDRIYFPSRISVCTAYKNDIHSTISRFSKYLGRPAELTDFAETVVAAYLQTYFVGRTVTTVNNERRKLFTVWTAAFDHGLLPQPPRKALIRKLPEDFDPPSAWTFPECEALFKAASEWPGFIDGISAGQWWRSLLLAIYSTGVRIGAILQTPVEHYQANEGLLVRKQKNHTPQWYALPRYACEAIDATLGVSRSLLWPWPYCRQDLYRVFRNIVERAAISQPLGGRQLFHRLRRTTLSYCAAEDPAIAQRQAGHSDYRLTLKHYIDPRLARGRSAADVLPEPRAFTTTPSQPGGDAAA
jgi:integrase